MLKIVVIENCNHCRHFTSDMYGERCWHPKVTKPHPEGKTPKKIPFNHKILIEIPKWCPLEDYENKSISEENDEPLPQETTRWF